MKRILTAFMVLFLITGCATDKADNNKNEIIDDEQTTETVETDTSVKPVNTDIIDITETVNNTLKDTFTFDKVTYDISVSKRDLTGSYDEVTGTVEFTDSNISVAGTNITVTDNTVKITAAGTYVLSGNGKATVIVEADSDSKVQLILNNLTLTDADNAAILIAQADKVFITLPDNTVNTISDVSGYKVIYDNSEVDGAIFSKDDLTVNGTGTLIVKGNNSHGIVCKDELTICGADIQITSGNTGINVNDSVKIINASITVTAGTDGIKADNSTDNTKGFIYLNDSLLNITAGDKGLQSTQAILIDSGTISISSKDDGFNSNNYLVINDGNITVKSSDDAIHADYILEINDGTVTVNAAEGLEATLVNINGGDVTINASDDGINGAKKISGITPAVTINGGTLTINMGQGDTDAIDSNGNLYINGGYITITAQSPFDYDGTGQLNCGTVIVNGQQVTQLTNQFMGGPGGMGGQGRPGR